LEEYSKTLDSNLLGYYSNTLLVKKILGSSAVFDFIEPQGGFNMGINIKSKKSSMELFKEIFLNTGVVLTPGEVFDMPKSLDPWFRITLANNGLDIETALTKVYE